VILQLERVWLRFPPLKELVPGLCDWDSVPGMLIKQDLGVRSSFIQNISWSEEADADSANFGDSFDANIFCCETIIFF